MNKLERVLRLADNTYNPASKSGTYSLKPVMHGSTLILRFSTIVNFASESSLRPQVQSAREHAQQLIKEFTSNLKKSFKEQSGESLSFDDKGGDDNIEIIQATSNSLRKVAYYKYNQTLEIK